MRYLPLRYCHCVACITIGSKQRSLQDENAAVTGDCAIVKRRRFKPTLLFFLQVLRAHVTFRHKTKNDSLRGATSVHAKVLNYSNTNKLMELYSHMPAWHGIGMANASEDVIAVLAFAVKNKSPSQSPSTESKRSKLFESTTVCLRLMLKKAHSIAKPTA